MAVTTNIHVLAGRHRRGFQLTLDRHVDRSGAVAFGRRGAEAKIGGNCRHGGPAGAAATASGAIGGVRRFSTFGRRGRGGHRRQAARHAGDETCIERPQGDASSALLADLAVELATHFNRRRAVPALTRIGADQVTRS